MNIIVIDLLIIVDASVGHELIILKIRNQVNFIILFMAIFSGVEWIVTNYSYHYVAIHILQSNILVLVVPSMMIKSKCIDAKIKQNGSHLPDIYATIRYQNFIGTVCTRNGTIFTVAHATLENKIGARSKWGVTGQVCIAWCMQFNHKLKRFKTSWDSAVELIAAYVQFV